VIELDDHTRSNGAADGVHTESMQRIGTGRLVVAIAALVGTLLASPVAAQSQSTSVPGLSGTATALAPAVRLPATTAPGPAAPAGSALLISDSAWLSFRLHGAMDAVQGFDHSLALASCRRRVSASCENFNDFVPITMYEELDNHPDGFTTLIVATGYNDSDGNFADDVRDIVTLARSHDYERIVWLTLRANVSYQSPGDRGNAAVFERSNETLRQIAVDGTYPDLVVADWATFARDEDQWFSDDGIHLRLAGSYAAGDYISRKMAFLDQRPCPEPAGAGLALADPCPDPDGHGPTIDLASLYPLTERGPDARFELMWEGAGSWPNAPWWDR